MADTQKPVEVPVEAPAAAPVETTTAAATEAVAAPAADAVPAVTAEAATDAAATTEAAAAPVEEAKKEEEAKPVEEGSLEHKGQGANFPKNFIYSKQLFWFGSDPVDLKSLSTFKADKVTEVAHHVTSWAAETGKGLLFFSEKGDKSAPHGAIHLAEVSEPAVEGPNKFHFTSKGHKHSFKAASTAERDNWVAQLKAKIAEAKELATTITETETYKKTLESLKPAPVKKEEKAVAPAAETAAEPAVAATEEGAAVAEAAAEAVKEETKEEEKKAEKEEPKRRSASRKRTSIFGSLLGGGKKEAPKAAEVTEAKPADAETPAVEPAVVEAPVAEVAAEPVVEAAPIATEAAAETKSEETAEAKAEDKKEETTPARPTHIKRTSIFGNLSFGKKRTAASPEASPTKEVPTTTEAVAETAPVIPAVETTEPLSTEVSSPATVPTETVEVAAAANGEPKKEVKSEKRKSSLPFVFGKKKEGSVSDEEAEKPKSPSAFSKLRATIKGKGKAEKAEKVEDKTEETAAVPAIPEAEVKAVDAIAEENTNAAAPAAAAEETPAKPPAATPVVTATA
ncbi:hypothetical protein BT67DRAFT_448109 [Trichocladium antarcticum]|uniref:PH domain-containing protein n=1 Tax=Trichocladium antarcticum TaxID=1450529 RepID=A0AAN6UPI8_9PEZI|nr:hypothetical protein BT67DRAFT_448109 [Trichocladium antarcticum]